MLWLALEQPKHLFFTPSNRYVAAALHTHALFSIFIDYLAVEQRKMDLLKIGTLV